MISENEHHNNWFPKYSMYVFNGFHKGFKWVSLLLWPSCNVLFFWVEEKNGMWYFGNQKIGLLMTWPLNQKRKKSQVANWKILKFSSKKHLGKQNITFAQCYVKRNDHCFIHLQVRHGWNWGSRHLQCTSAIITNTKSNQDQFRLQLGQKLKSNLTFYLPQLPWLFKKEDTPFLFVKWKIFIIKL